MRWYLAIAGLIGLAALAAGAHAFRLVTLERHSGYIAPVWSADGEAVYALRRETSGVTWGPGWEFFTPPAHALIRSDDYSLVRIPRTGGGEEVLAEWSESPLEGRVVRTYRGRIFTLVGGRVSPVEEGLRVELRISIPVVPRSEIWGIDTVWGGDGFDPAWQADLPGQYGRPDEVLTDGREVMALPGPEGFAAAVIVVEADGRHSVIARTPGFEAQYPDGIPPSLITDRSLRDQIERGRLFRARKSELVARIMEEEGLNEGAAAMRAFDVMEREGLLPPRRRIVAEVLGAGEPDFEIPQLYLDVGLFQDIADAIAVPGEAVLASTGSYLIYAGDDLGPRVKAHLDSEGTVVIRVGEALYRIGPG